VSTENPFASPQAPSSPAQTARTHTASSRNSSKYGAWRDGSLLVISKGASLPNRCVSCDAPALERPLRIRLAWHSPLAYLALLVGLLPYVLVSLKITKRLEACVGICDQHAKKRRMFILVTASVFLLGLSLFALVLTDTVPNGWLALSGLATMLLSLIPAYMGPRTLRPSRIESDLAWVKGACPEYLNRLPEFEG
jgi:hypothetical protein